MDIISQLKIRAKEVRGSIVLPEAFDRRTLEAAQIIAAEGLASVMVVGKPESVKVDAAAWGVDLQGIQILDPDAYSETDKFASFFY